jgi:hypothetical protein
VADVGTPTPSTAAAGTVRWFDVVVGQCVDDQDPFGDAGTLVDIKRLACSQPHDYELVAVARVDGTAYPGEYTMKDNGDAWCLGKNAAEEGRYPDLSLGYTVSIPDGAEWAAGHRMVACWVGGYDDQLTGSLGAV